MFPECPRVERADYTCPMQCNIDAKGKRARLITGLLTVVAGLVVAGLVMRGVLPGWCVWVVMGALVGGGFAIFEARSGWCALRAMGVKTPL